MVEKSSDGIYTVNIANILPNDKIAVIIEYTQLLEWRQNQVRYALPTTIAPKYGNPSNLNLDDVTTPVISLLAENLFSFNMSVKGVLADSEIVAPSHKVDINKNELHTLITLKKEKDFMDKDIVFTFKTEKSKEERSFALVGKDIDGYAAIASFYPPFINNLPKDVKSVTFVVDCSGSMSGVSISRAKIALSKALTLFGENDSFNIIKFGSSYEVLFEKEVSATTENLHIARVMIDALDADMGGTEMGVALQRAYAGHINSKEKKGYLFLITDGEVYKHGKIIEDAKKSEMSHFVVGVGYASDDPLLRKMASETRGSFESVDPNEKMDDYILNLFKKIDTPKAVEINVQWSTQAKINHKPKVVFDGDTIYAYGTFNEAPLGEVSLSYTLENGNTYHANTMMKNEFIEEKVPSVISKLVIAKEIELLMQNSIDNESKIIQYSIQYQLFSEVTNYILVDEIAESEKPLTVPTLHRVSNMMVETMDYNICHSEPNVCYSYEYEDDLEYPTLLRRQMDYGDSYTNITDFRKQMEANYTNSIDGDYINTMPTYKIERYLLLFNDWFIIYNRLPKSDIELGLMGISESIDDIEEFVSLLYTRWLEERQSLDDIFDNVFVHYLTQ